MAPNWLLEFAQLGEFHRRPQLDLVEQCLEARVIRRVAPILDRPQKRPQPLARDRPGQQAKPHLLEHIEHIETSLRRAAPATGAVGDLLHGEQGFNRRQRRASGGCGGDVILFLGNGDGFVAKFDKNGALDWSHQFNGSFANVTNGIAFDTDGTNVLSRLGLPEGKVPPDISDNVTAVSATRPGAFFYISVDDGELQKIQVENDDTFGFLSYKIRRAIGALDPTLGNAVFVDDDIEGRHLKIQALNGHKIQIFAGSEGFDALKGLGLKEAVLFGEAPEGDTESAANNAFGLGFTSDMSIATPDETVDALVLLKNAQRIVRKAYTLLTQGPEEEDILPKGQASALTLKRLASYQDALSRLQNLNPVNVGAVPSLF